MRKKLSAPEKMWGMAGLALDGLGYYGPGYGLGWARFDLASCYEVVVVYLSCQDRAVSCTQWTGLFLF